MLSSACSEYFIIVELSVVVCIDSKLDRRCEAVGAVWTGQWYYEFDLAVLA